VIVILKLGTDQEIVRDGSRRGQTNQIITGITIINKAHITKITVLCAAKLTTEQ
jgi:hypothetical protein